VTGLPSGVDGQAVAAAVPLSVWLVSPSGTVRYANPHALAYTGGRADALAWSSVVRPVDAGQYEVECSVRRADGATRRHLVRFVPQQEDWLVTATEVTAPADAAAVLETFEAAVPVGVGVVGRDGRLTRVNSTLAALSGLPRAQQPGRPPAEVFPAFWPQVDAGYRGVWETGMPWVGSASVTVDDEGPRSWLAGCHPVRSGDEMIGVALVLEDSTEREQARAFRSVIMDDMAEGLYTVDGDGKLTSMNRAATQMLGWDEKELLGRSAHEMMHAPRPDGSPQPESECPLRRIRTAGLSAQTVDETFARRDGSTFEVVCSVAPLHTGGPLPGAVVTFRDMTEVRRAEVEARHDQKLESLGRLSAGLAHEINTPIQFVGDNTRFLADAYRDMLELLLVYRECMAPALGELEWGERTRRAQEAENKADIEYLETEIPAAVSQSLEGVERVASLVRAMKSFSYKDSTEQAYADLNEAIRTTLTVARNEVKYVADVHLELGELPEVLCHLGDLNQVFLNLLVNAADALKDKGGRGEIRIGSRMEGTTAVISFADDGAGIPAELHQSIFEPFFTTKEVGKGTGQGLALARAVLEKHGGSIEVRSVPGEGSEFVLRLPVAGKPDAAA